MRITYIAHSRFPTEKAHGHQIAQVCDALVSLHHDVTLIVPNVKTLDADPHVYYGTRNVFPIVRLEQMDAFHTWWVPKAFAFTLMMYSYRKKLRSYLAHNESDFLYTRSPAILRTLLETKLPVILELHDLPRYGLRRLADLCNRCVHVVCLTSWIRSSLVENGADPARLVVEPNAVDFSNFEHTISKDQMRERFGIHTSRCIVGYVGQLKTMNHDKGVSILLSALARLKEQKRFFGLIVGGPPKDQEEYQRFAYSLGLGKEDVYFAGEIHFRHVPAALAACDILAMPFPDTPYYRTKMCPLKTFEYMAAERPILTSDLPTMRDLLSDDTAFFCKPGAVDSLVETLSYILDHPLEARHRSKNASMAVQFHTWEKRMQRIFSRAGRSSSAAPQQAQER